MRVLARSPRPSRTAWRPNRATPERRPTQPRGSSGAVAAQGTATTASWLALLRDLRLIPGDHEEGLSSQVIVQLL